MKKLLSTIIAIALTLMLFPATAFADDDKIPMEKCKITFDKEYEWTGNGITPTPKVTYGKKKLVKNEDYNIVYKDNVHVGTATATLLGLGKYSGSTTATFTIVKGKQTIKASDIKATYGDPEININATASTPMSYKSSNEDIAYVTQVGTILIKGAGECKITIIAEETSNVKKAKKMINVKIAKAPSEVVAYGGIVKKGEKHELHAESSSGGKLTYESSNKKIATVSKKGVVKALKKGKCTITVKAAATKNYKEAKTTVDIEVI